MRRGFLGVAAVALLLAGCAGAPAAALRPVDARARLLADQRIAGWYAAHSAPLVLADLSPWQAKRWRRYEPAVMFDRVDEGLLVRLEAGFGPAPRRLEALLDRETGAVLRLQER